MGLHFVWRRAIRNRGTLMTGFILSRLVMVAAVAGILAVQAAAEGADSGPTAAKASAARRVIVVSLKDRRLALVEDGQVIKVYPVAVGKPSTPSPEGTFAIARRVKNPTYAHDGKTILPGPGNPVGTRWMGLSIRGFGIHGTNEPHSIGKAASHGCIRMAKADLEELYELVAVGDTVELIGERDEETARLFGDPQDNPATAAAQAPAMAGNAPPQLLPASAPATEANATTAQVEPVVVAGSR